MFLITYHKLCDRILHKKYVLKKWLEKTEPIYNCYIAYDMDFWFIPSDPVCFGRLSRCD